MKNKDPNTEIEGQKVAIGQTASAEGVTRSAVQEFGGFNFMVCGNKWPEATGPSSWDNCDQSGISYGSRGGDDVYLFNEAPIVIATVQEFEGQPQKVKLRWEYEWIDSDGDVVADGVIEQDEVKDAGDGRYWKWWSMNMSITPRGEDLGRKLFFRVEVSDELNPGVSNEFDSRNLDLGFLVEGGKDARIVGAIINDRPIL